MEDTVVVLRESVSSKGVDEVLLDDVERLADRQTVLAVLVLILLPIIGVVHGLNSGRGDEAIIAAVLEGGLGIGVGLIWYTRQKLQAKTSLLLSKAAVKSLT